MTNKKSVGKLNGRWARLFQLVLVLTPLVVTAIIGWTTWATIALVKSGKDIQHLTVQVKKLEEAQQLVTKNQVEIWLMLNNLHNKLSEKGSHNKLVENNTFN